MAQTPKKYICCYCSRAFTRSEHKQRHERSHTNEKPFGCQYCNSAFVRRDLLQRHCRTVHNVRLAGRALKDGKEPRTFEVMPLEQNGGHPAGAKAGPAEPALGTRNNSLSSPPLLAMAKPDSHLVASAQVLLQMAPKRSEGPAFTDPVSPSSGPYGAKPTPEYTHSSVLMSPTSGQTHHHTTAAQTPNGAAHTPTAATFRRGSNDSDQAAGFRSATSGPSPSELHFSRNSTEHDFGPAHLAGSLKDLRSLCTPDDLAYPVDDLFLAGCAVLSNEPLGMLSYSTSSLQEVMWFWLSGQSEEFRRGNAYTLLAIGALNTREQAFDNEGLATTLINKSWTILTDTLIPGHTKVADQIEILRNLYLLAYAYLRFFNNDLMLSYLEDSADIILKNISVQSGSQSILDANMELLWSVYTLVSKAKVNKGPPVFFSWFLSLRVKGTDCLLSELVRSCPKPEYFTPGNPVGEIIVCTVMSEVNDCVVNEKRRVFSSKKDIRQALKNIAQCIEASASKAAHKIDAFELFKAKLLIDNPNNLKDHVSPIVFQISEPAQWTLLFATIRGLDPFINVDTFVEENSEASFQAIGTAYLSYFFFKTKLTQAFFDQLAISAFPLIFNHKLLTADRKARNFKTLHLVDRVNLSRFVLHWYVMVVKVLVTLADKIPYRASLEKLCTEFPVLGGLFYALGHDIRKTGDHSNFLMSVLEDVTKICDGWIVCVHSPNYLQHLRQTLYRCSKELLDLAATHGNFSLANICVTNDAITLVTKRSKSISSIEMGSPRHSSFSGPGKPFHYLPDPKSSGQAYRLPQLETTGAPKTSNPNYVLSGDSEPHPFPQPGSLSVPPLKPAGFTQPSAYAPALPAASRAPMVLPPLHTSMRENHGFVPSH